MTKSKHIESPCGYPEPFLFSSAVINYHVTIWKKKKRIDTIGENKTINSAWLVSC